MSSTQTRHRILTLSLLSLVACGAHQPSPQPQVARVQPAPALLPAPKTEQPDPVPAVRKVRGPWNVLIESPSTQGRVSPDHDLVLLEDESAWSKNCDGADASDPQFVNFLNENRISLSCTAKDLGSHVPQTSALHHLIVSRSAPNDDVPLANLAQLTHLRSLDASSAKLTDRETRKLWMLKDLVALDLSNAVLAEKGLRGVGRLANLKRLNLESAHLSEGYLAHLARLTKLEWLNLRSTRVSSVAPLAGLPLRTLHIDALKSVSSFKDLRTLSVAEAEPEPLSALALPELRSLSLQGALCVRIPKDGGYSEYKDTRIASINPSNLPKLETLDLSGRFLASNNLNAADLAHLENFAQLRDLNLARAVFEEGLTVIDRLVDLKHLDLSSSTRGRANPYREGNLALTQADFLAVAKLTHLKSLMLRDLPVTNQVVAALTTLQDLQILDLTQTGINDACVDDLAKFKNLRRLYVGGGYGNDRGLLSAAARERLTALLPNLKIRS